MITKHSRRSFLRQTCTAALAPIVTGYSVFGEDTGVGPQVFSPLIGVCTSVRQAPLLRAVGIDYIEESVRRLLIPDRPEEEFATNLEAALRCGLPVIANNGFLPGSLKSTGPDSDHEGVLEYAATAFRRAEQVGIKTIVFGSSGSRSIPEGFDRDRAGEQFVSLLKNMGPLAADHDVVVAVEPLQRSETNFINTVVEGARIVRAVSHPNIRLLADIFHMLRMEEPPDHIRLAGELICHLHIAEKARRTPPGVEGDDFRSYFQALKDIGYRGAISIECGWDSMSEQLPVALKTLREQLAWERLSLLK